MTQDVPDSSTIQQTTRDVLSRPEFQFETRDVSWLRNMVDGIADWFRGLSSWAEAAPAAAQLLTVVLTVVLVALIVHILYTTFKEVALVRGYARQGKRKAGLVALEGEADTRDEALDMCRQALQGGDLRRAIWIMHRLFLSLLDEQGALHFSRWKTNGDYLVECRADHPDHSTLVGLTQAYEDIIYGHYNASDYDLETLFRKVEAVGGAT